MRVAQRRAFDLTALLGAGLMLVVLQHAPHARFSSHVRLDIAPAQAEVAPHAVVWDRIVIDLAPPSHLRSPNLTPGQRELAAARAEQRLREALTDDLLRHFKLFLYVSKADRGLLAQRMFVFDRQRHGALHLLYDWPVSTGRETVERNPAGRQLATDTPAGYYQLDRKRFYRHYRSAQWGEPMPYAMFFNWVDRGRKTGLAVHAANGVDIARLGSRASAGCVRLAPENARTLFELIRTRYKGAVPRFAFDRRSGTMSNDGELMRDAHGAVKLSKGYRVLVLIENTGGSGAVAAML